MRWRTMREGGRWAGGSGRAVSVARAPGSRDRPGDNSQQEGEQGRWQDPFRLLESDFLSVCLATGKVETSLAGGDRSRGPGGCVLSLQEGGRFRIRGRWDSGIQEPV